MAGTKRPSGQTAVTSVDFSRKSIGLVFPPAQSTPQSYILLLLFAGATPSLLLPSLPLTVLPTHSVGASSLRSVVPLPFVCWHLLLSTGSFTSASCCASASCHTSASCCAPLVWLVVPFPSTSASPSRHTSARLLGLHHSSCLHLWLRLSCLVGCSVA